MNIQPAADAPEAAPTTGDSSAFTARAITLGVILAVVIGCLAPLNDWYLKNTYFYGQHMPILVTGVIVALAIINPLLGRFRFNHRESVLVVGVVLVLGGSVSTGLTRLWPATVGAPARLIPIDHTLRPLAEEGIGAGTVPLFTGVDGQGRVDQEAPGYDGEVRSFFLGDPADGRVKHRATVSWSVDGGLEQRAVALADGAPGAPEGTLDLDAGLGAEMAGSRSGSGGVFDGQRYEVVAVEPGGIPWGVWLAKLMAWLPLLACLLVSGIAICGVVRQQWIHHERLPYPIAQIWGDLLERSERPRFRRPSAMFLAAFSIPVVVLGSQALVAWGALPLSIPTNFPIGRAFGSGDFFWDLKLFFGIAAIGFMLPAQTSLSLWLMPLAMKLLVMVSKSQGLPIEAAHMGPASMGGFMVLAVMIAWIGRHYYLRLLRTAFRRIRDEPDAAVRAGAAYARLLLASGIAMIAVLAAMGAPVGLALILVLASWAMLLVIGRLVAESGIPLVNIPMLPNQFLISIFGTGIGAAALLPLCLPWMITDGREHLVPFYLNADRLADDRTAHGWRWPTTLAAVVVVGGLVSAGVMVVLGYQGGGMQHLDGFWRATAMTGLKPMATLTAGESQVVAPGTYSAYVSGGIVTALLAIGRLNWAWWPLHPVGVVVGGTYAAATMWTSFMIGWLVKVGVQRYGGQAIYHRLRPAVLGLIVGEAAIAATFATINFLVKLGGGTPPDLPRFLPI